MQTSDHIPRSGLPRTHNRLLATYATLIALTASELPAAADPAMSEDHVPAAAAPPARSRPIVGPAVYAELSVLDAPFVAANGGSVPSMEQSLWLTAGLYQGMHLGLAKLVDPSSPMLWRKALGIMLVTTTDALTATLPGLAGWQHEEWHRAVLSSRGIDSFNDIYRLQLFAEIVNVSHVRDEDLVRLKARHPADQVRLSTAGIEGNYAGVHALENAAFFHDTRSWNTGLYWVLYFLNRQYLALCARTSSDDLVDRANAAEGADVPRRDFTGPDCDGWVYDLFHPDEPYEARGVHPSGVGIDRYRSYSRLAPEEQAYLRRQANLSLLNFLDPNLFGIHRIRWPWSAPEAPIDFNVAVRYLPSAFGYDLRADVFVRQGESFRALVGLHAGVNRTSVFPGLEAEVMRIPVALIDGAPLELDARANVWLQPDGLRFDSSHHVLGGLASLRASWGGRRTIAPFVGIEAKTAGWVSGNVYLDRNVSVRAGMIVRL